MPRLQMPRGVSMAFEGNSLADGNIVYRLLVPLGPPPAHTFHLEQDPEGESGARNSRIRVQLHCTCAREQPVGDMPCFLHDRKRKLWRERMPSLLPTLCTDSYLDLQKTAAWFQELVTEAWAVMPQSSAIRLEVLPSACFCKLRLTTASSRVFCIELVLAAPQGDSGSFLTLE